MAYYYSSNRNVQILVALLKAHNIKRVIASPGTTNLELMASLQQDSFFEMYSCIDERSAAYLACGLATETGEPVVITCTEATASRNYYSGLTEAFHRKLPILAVTGLHDYSKVGHLIPQVIDRSDSPNDSMKLKVNLPVINCEEEAKESEFLINKAILELTRKGGGPVHINIPWGGGKFDFSIKELPKTRVIKRFTYGDNLPEIPKGKVAVLVGGHNPWSAELTAAVDRFCEKYDAVVFCDHTSKYYGRFRFQSALLAFQQIRYDVFSNINILVHIGEEFGDDTTIKKLEVTGSVWRVSPDGELRDTLGKLSTTFEMSELEFFKCYSTGDFAARSSLIEETLIIDSEVRSQIPSLPFSSIYVASELSSRLPEKSVMHLGVSDTIRAWNLFPLPKGSQSRVNSGCRGIDGCVSAMIGASLSNKDTLFFGVFGDLTFFYDMNVLGNRNINENVRIVLLNNDGGNIFRHNGHVAMTWLGFDEANKYIAAAGHYGKKSPDFVKHFSEDLGFEYLSARNKDELSSVIEHFTSSTECEKPMLLEVFTESRDDSNAFDIMANVSKDSKGQVKALVKGVMGEQGTALLRKIIR